MRSDHCVRRTEAMIRVRVAWWRFRAALWRSVTSIFRRDAESVTDEHAATERQIEQKATQLRSYADFIAGTSQNAADRDRRSESKYGDPTLN